MIKTSTTSATTFLGKLFLSMMVIMWVMMMMEWKEIKAYVPSSYKSHAIRSKRILPKKINVEETTQSLNQIDDDFRLDSFWYLFSSPTTTLVVENEEEKENTPFKTSGNNNNANSHYTGNSNNNNMAYGYGSLDKLIGEAPSFEVLSNNIKSIPTDSKTAWLPTLNAWRNLVHHEDIVPAEEKDLAPPTLVSYLEGNSRLSETHHGRVLELWLGLKGRGSLRSASEKDEQKIIEALNIAYIALWGKKTERSMEVSINRARGTARVLAECNSGLESVDIILAGILHEVLYECSPDAYNLICDGIQQRFGSSVVSMIEKYIKLPKFKALKANYTPIQSENMIQMLVASCEDIDVLFIRLADRIHTMRNLRHLPLNETERVKIAQEVVNVYAPLAHRMLLLKVKEELEDLAFRTIDPRNYQKSKYTQVRANKAAFDAEALIREQIVNDPYIQSQGKVELHYRVKSKYQLHLKMVRKNITSLNDLKDAIGLRLIFSPKRFTNETHEDTEKRAVDMCYYMVNRLKMLPGWKPDKCTKDYIKDKKETGYQSIHQFLYSESLKVPVEVQVRTKSMHYNAELGEAAHWYYKDLIYRPEIVNTKAYKIAWRSSKQIKAESAATLFKLARQQLLQSRVFVFLDDHATVVSFKKGSTVLDAAFTIHTKLGLTTSFVKVGGRPVELSQPLNNGDVISVQGTVDGSVTAKPSWLGFVKSKTAQTTLKTYFKDGQHEMQNVVLGLIQFIMALTSNIDLVIARYHGIPDARDLSKMVRSHTTYSDLSQLLCELNNANKSEVGRIMADLLDIPVEYLHVCSASTALLWAKLQGRNGWADKRIRNLVLLPALNDLLPSLGVTNALSLWSDIVGSKSLTNEQSPLSSSLSSSFSSSPSSSSLSSSLSSDTILERSQAFRVPVKAPTPGERSWMKQPFRSFMRESSTLNSAELLNEESLAQLLSKKDAVQVESVRLDGVRTSVTISSSSSNNNDNNNGNSNTKKEDQPPSSKRFIGRSISVGV